jgi:prepilin-type N-terminal cleavage/methylation domain-containing protein
MKRRGGFTLIEMLLVVVLLAMAAALVVPAIRSMLPARTGLGALVPAARKAAERRGETIYLRIRKSGDWRMEGEASTDTGPLATGRVDPFPGLPLTLIVSPRGSCAFDPQSSRAARSIRLDSLPCKAES